MQCCFLLDSEGMLMSLVQKLKYAAIAVGVCGSVYGLAFLGTQAGRDYAQLYAESQMPITGTVLAARYRSDVVSVLANPDNSSSASVMSKSTLTLNVRTDDGLTLAVVVTGYSNGRNRVDNTTVDGLAAIVREGSKVSFPTGNIPEPVESYFLFLGPTKSSYPIHGETWFGPAIKYGVKSPDRITVLEN